MKRVFLLASGMALAVGAMAQSRSSFFEVTGFTDVLLNITNGGLTYTLTMGAAPKMTVGGNTYDIEDIFGVWAISDDDDLFATNSNVGVWTVHHNNAGAGGIAGWKTNPNTGVYGNQSIVLPFSSLNVASVEHQGFHVRVFGNVPIWGGNTGYAYAGVPEPSSFLAVAALGGLALARRRSKK